METKGFTLRECSVRLRRCDRALGPKPDRCSAAHPEPAAPPAPVHTSVPLVIVKTECDAEDVAQQETHTYSLERSETVINSGVEQAYEFIVKTEDEVDEVRVKQELDVGPTVLTPQTVRRAEIPEHLGGDERPGPSAAAPAPYATILAEPGPSTKVVDDCCKTDPGIWSDGSVVFDMKGADYLTRRSHHCRCCVRPQTECDCNKDGSRAKITAHMSEGQFLGERYNYNMTNTPNFITHTQTHMDEQMSDCEEHEHSLSQLHALGRDICCQRSEKLYKRKPCVTSAPHQGHFKEYLHPRSGQDSYQNCERRGYSAHGLGSLEKHLHTHVGKKPYSCKQCEYSGSKLGYLTMHMRTHMGEKPYKCEQCEYSACRLSTLKIHMRTHTGEKPYKCEQCEYSASELGTLKRHMRLHTGEKPYKCGQCEYSAWELNTLKRHMCLHTGEKPYKCEQCEYSASELSKVKRHMRTHTGEKPFKCEQCEYSASELSTLKSHIRLHTGEKPYKCEQCEYSASELGKLKIHMRTHTGERPYKCEQCEYSTSHSGNLTVHIRTHTGEKPYKCEQCEYSTSHSGNLMVHMWTHTGEKPYKCEQCEYSTSRLGNLTKHLHTHSSEK